MTGCGFLINPIILRINIEYVHKNLILDLKINLSAFGVKLGERDCQ